MKLKKKKSISKLKKEVQVLFNTYIRKRDTLLGQEFICISCGNKFPISKMDAGHYFPIKGFNHLRFNEDNCHGECKGCNGFKDYHLICYTWNLINKIGVNRYNELFVLSTIGREEFTREELEELKIKYKQ